MSNRIACDRCDAIVAPSDGARRWLRVDVPRSVSTLGTPAYEDSALPFDICGPCHSLLLAWLKGTP